MLPSLSLPADIESLHESHSLRKQSVSIIGPKYCPKYYPHHGGPFQVHETITEAMYNRALLASPLPPSLPPLSPTLHTCLLLFSRCQLPSSPFHLLPLAFSSLAASFSGSLVASQAHKMHLLHTNGHTKHIFFSSKRGPFRFHFNEI